MPLVLMALVEQRLLFPNRRVCKHSEAERVTVVLEMR